ncbi:putative membrane protein [Synechococcus sp. PROS-U-1]|nr:putative membrane protein [Synechococcus sp. PROS-U-1]
MREGQALVAHSSWRWIESLSGSSAALGFCAVVGGLILA